MLQPTHLTMQQMIQLEKISMVSRAKFDELFKAYSGSSWYRIGKDTATSYLPTRVSNFWYPPHPADLLVTQVGEVMQAYGTDADRFREIAKLIKNFVSLDANFHESTFCQYLVKRLGELVADSSVQEHRLGSSLGGAMRWLRGG